MNKNRAHWFVSPTGHMFYTCKVLNKWRFIGKDTYVIHEKRKLPEMVAYVKTTFGFTYLGLM